MAATITLSDGRAMMGSNLGVSSMFWLISREVSTEVLKYWLCNMSERPSGYLDFDIRGLDSQMQEEFWLAADSAFNILAAKHGPSFLERENAYGANCLARLLEMRKREMAGEPPLSLSDFSFVLEWDNVRIDIADLWSETSVK